MRNFLIAHIPPAMSAEFMYMFPRCDDESETNANSLGEKSRSSGLARAARTTIEPAEWPKNDNRPTVGSALARSGQRCMMKFRTWADENNM